LLLAHAVSLASAQDEGAPSVPKTVLRVSIDGRLDEEAWRSAADLGPLTQREPREGTVPSEQTTVLVVADDERLYIGIRCDDSDPRGRQAGGPGQRVERRRARHRDARRTRHRGAQLLRAPMSASRRT
jgi:hypothetical protein